MGAKNCPETPRQKMINMMYLVLTAMLALNVSVETLNAFKVIDASMVKSLDGYTKKNSSILEDFEWQVNNGQNKQLASVYIEKAKTVHSISESIISIIVGLKQDMAIQAGAEKLNPGEELPSEYPHIVTKDNDTLILKRQDDLNVSPLIMVERGKGEELKAKILEYKEQMIAIIKNDSLLKNRFGDSFYENIEKTLDVSDPVTRDKDTNSKTWVQLSFGSSPVIASITLLDKMQSDVCFTESSVLTALYSALSEESSFEAKVIPKSTYVISGSQNFEAEIFLSAVTNVPEANVYVNGSSTPIPLQGGKAIFKASSSEPGKHQYRGEIRYMYEGNPASAPFSGEYEVAAPTATISPSKMNVLYRGIENPLEISVPGVSSSQVRATIDNGSIAQGQNQWVAKPTSLNTNTKVTVYANLDGKEVLMGVKTFRVKDVPPPLATLGVFTSGANIPRAYLNPLQVKNLTATLEDFLFDLEFEVTSFDVSVPTGGGMTATASSSSELFTAAQKTLLTGVKKGDKIIFENIKARIKGNSTVTNVSLSPTIYTVN
ncbi:MAG TPA: gliding motility protein GldM [Prolixibacteraceae bacterium]|nr:gliding motility protein GldM [Prolixibacteraceae bacterium]